MVSIVQEVFSYVVSILCNLSIYLEEVFLPVNILEEFLVGERGRGQIWGYKRRITNYVNCKIVKGI